MFFLSAIAASSPRQELENLFLDKVIANLGLCVSVYGIHSISSGFIFPRDGAPIYTCRRGCIFCGLIMKNLVNARWNADWLCSNHLLGEIIDAKLKEFNKDVSMGFFDDIYISFHRLPHPSRFAPDPEDGNLFRWVCEYGTANEEQEKAEASETTYPIDEIGETRRFRVHNINYPPLPLEQPKDAKPFAPMFITGSLDNDGLGLLSWWE